MDKHIQLLRDACKGRSLREVGTIVGLSKSTISQLLSGQYSGDFSRIKSLIERKLGRAVECPVLGKMPRMSCLKMQSGEVRNSLAPLIRQACKTCDHEMKMRKPYDQD